MKNTIVSLFALLACSQAGNAQISGMNIGYCNGMGGTFPSTSNNYFADLSTKKDTWTSSAILLKEEKIKSLAGNEIKEVRAYLPSKLSADTLAVWVSESLDGPVLASDTITDITKTWNTLPLKTPVGISADMRTLYIGYSYHQKSTCKALGVRNTGTPGYSCFVRSGNDEWKDFSDTYTTCVEAMVYGDNLPKYDLALEKLSVQPHYVVDNGTLDITMRVRNNATVTISSFDAVCSIEGISEKYTAHIDSALAYNEEKEISFTIKPEAIQTMDPDKRTITVTIDNLAEGEDEIKGDNTMQGEFGITLHSFDRQVLLEEFTTEKCQNCPRVAQYVHNAMINPEYQGRLNTMESHVGYYTDSFTTTFHNSWLWFFDNEYAPALMFDRHADEGSATAVRSVATEPAFISLLRERLNEPAFVSLKIAAELDVDNQLINVKVTGTRAKKDFTTNPSRITVVLTETNLKAISQAGAGSDYTHYNVGRRVSETWGDVLEWDGDDYTYECSIPYTQNYDMENLGILAFIHDYDPEDKTKCEVANSAAITSAEFKNIEAGINTIANGNDADEKIYDLSGRRIAACKNGVSIIVSNGKSYKVAK